MGDAAVPAGAAPEGGQQGAPCLEYTNEGVPQPHSEGGAAGAAPDSAELEGGPEPPAAEGEPAGGSYKEADEVKKEEQEDAAADPAAAAPPVAGSDRASNGVGASEPKPSEGAAAAVKGEGDIDEEQLLLRCRELLARVDLTMFTVKELRQQLEAELGLDLHSRRKLLKREMKAYIMEHYPEQEEEQEGEGAEAGGEGEGEEAEGDDSGGKKRRRGGWKPRSELFGSKLSEAMQAFMGVDRLPRTQVVKRLWEYIKANDLQDPKNRRRILLDDKLSTIFPGKSVNMLTMNKHLSRHCFTEDAVGGSEDEEEEEAGSSGDEGGSAPRQQQRPAAKRARSSGGSRSRSSSAADSGAPKKATGFTKQCKLSEAMAAWMGGATASRPEVTRHFWTYVKEHELQDPANKAFILADATLEGLTGEKRFKGFSFNGKVKEHFLGYED